jgi:hypothetical protein
MRHVRYAPICAIAFSALMIHMWTFFIVMSQVPEYNSRPAEITLHLIDELLTALLLVGSGVFAIRGARCADLLLLAAFGMLLYTLIASPGYYIQSGEVPFVIMFAVLSILALVALVLQIRTMIRHAR